MSGLKHTEGNMAEYMLPAVLIAGVVLVGIAGLVVPTFESNSGKMFQGTKQMSLQGNASIQTRAIGKNPGLQPLMFQLSDGTSITLEDFPASMNALVETEGINGATEKYLKAIKELADKLLAEGKISEAEANQIKALSNRGFDMAGNIQFVENAAQTCEGSRSCLGHEMEQTKATWCSTSLGVQQHLTDNICSASMARWVSESEKQWIHELMPSLDSLSAQNNQWWLGEHNAAFVAQYKAVQTAPSLSADVKSVLKYLSIGVFRNTLLTHVSTHEILSAPETSQPMDLATVVAQHWGTEDQMLRSELTASLSGEICDVGHGETHGHECQ